MTGKKKAVFLIVGFVMLAGFLGWVVQVREGLILTNLQNSYSWGLYVSGLAFFVGNAAGGLVLSSMIYLFGVTSLKPLAKLGALTAFANVIAAMLSILPDIGRPARLYQLLLHPQPLSPLVWDVVVLNLYAVLSLVYLYLLLLPDLRGPFRRIALRVADPEAFSERWARRLAPFSLVAAVGIHVITAWVFSTQGARDWWFSASLAPDFVAAALASGTALVLLVAVLTCGIQDELRQAYRTLAVLIAVAFFVHLFLMYNDMFIHAWYGAEETAETLGITLKDYRLAHLFEVLAPLAAVILLLNSRTRKRAGLVAASSALVIAGIFVHRYLLMPGAFERVPLTLVPLGLQGPRWSVPIASGRYDQALDTFVTHWPYFPSGVEIAIFLGVLAFMVLLVLVAVDRLPILKSEALP